MARPEEITDGIVQSVYFPATVRNHYTKLAVKKGTSFSRMVVRTLEKSMKERPKKTPDSEFGEFQFD